MSQAEDQLLNRPEEQLPFSDAQQSAFLGHALHNEKFFTLVKPYVYPAFFLNAYNGMVWEAKVKYFNELGRIPTLEEVRSCSHFMCQKPDVRGKMGNAINLSKQKMTEFSLEHLTPQLDAWAKCRVFYDAFYKMKKYYQEGKVENIETLMEQTSRTLKVTSFADDGAYNFNDLDGYFKKKKEQYTGSLTFGSQLADENMITPPNCEHCLGSKHVRGAKCIACAGLGFRRSGGLLKQDVTIILASTNTGKSTTLLTIAAANVRERKNVLFVSHEGREDDLADKFWRTLAGITEAEHEAMYRDPQQRKELNRWLREMNDHFIYQPMAKPGLTVEEVYSQILRAQDKFAALHNGEGFDLVVDDYLAKVTTEQAKHGKMERRHIDEITYNYAVQMALEQKFHFLTAIQTNREGGKVNNGKAQEGRLNTLEDVAESYGPMQAVANVVSANRSPSAEAQGHMTFLFCKSRTKKKNWAMLTKTDFAKACTHGDHLDALVYNGTFALHDRQDMLLSQLLKAKKNRTLAAKEAEEFAGM